MAPVRSHTQPAAAGHVVVASATVPAQPTTPTATNAELRDVGCGRSALGRRAREGDVLKGNVGLIGDEQTAAESGTRACNAGGRRPSTLGFAVRDREVADRDVHVFEGRRARRPSCDEEAAVSITAGQRVVAAVDGDAALNDRQVGCDRDVGREGDGFAVLGPRGGVQGRAQGGVAVDAPRRGQDAGGDGQPARAECDGEYHGERLRAPVRSPSHPPDHLSYPPDALRGSVADSRACRSSSQPEKVMAGASDGVISPDRPPSARRRTSTIRRNAVSPSIHGDHRTSRAV